MNYFKIVKFTDRENGGSQGIGGREARELFNGYEIQSFSLERSKTFWT
jgi:hypothetical protein